MKTSGAGVSGDGGPAASAGPWPRLTNCFLRWHPGGTWRPSASPGESGRCWSSVARSRVLLLDEPSLGLARLVLVQIMARIKTMVHERGLTVLLIEQNAKSALSVADEGIVLHLGKVVARGRAYQLMSEERLRHAYLGF